MVLAGLVPSTSGGDVDVTLDLPDIAFWWLLALFLFDLSIRIAAIIIIPRNRRPTSAMAWLLAIYFIPIVGVLLFLRLLVINALVNWFGLGPMAAFLVALAAVTPASHLLGSRLTWRGVRS